MKSEETTCICQGCIMSGNCEFQGDDGLYPAWYSGTDQDSNTCEWRVVVKPKETTMTNGDTIRSMSDEELAKLPIGHCDFCPAQIECPAVKDEDREDIFYKWLGLEREP